MRKHTKLLLLASLVSLAGCGGADGAEDGVTPISAVIGSYTGTYSGPGVAGYESGELGPLEGTLTVAIASDGLISGTVTRNSVVMIVRQDLSYVRRGLQTQIVTQREDGITFGFLGQLKRASDGTLSGTLNENLGDFDRDVAIRLVKVP